MEEKINIIKNDVDTSDYETRIIFLDELYEKWIHEPDSTKNIYAYLDRALHNFQLDKNNLNMSFYETAYKTELFRLNYLQLRFIKEEEVDDDISNKFTRLFTALIDADNAITSSLFLKCSMTKQIIDYDKNNRHHMFRYSVVDYGKLNSYQTLIIYLIDRLKRKEYKRYVVDEKGMCYKKVYNSKGFDTHAWEKVMSVKQFIYSETQQKLNFEMWVNATNPKDNISAAVKYLTEYSGDEFPDLVRNRNVFSFNNGIYITKVLGDSFEDKWIPYEESEGFSFVSCKLFNQDFEYCDQIEWFEIIKQKCPNFYAVMEYQQWPDEVKKWLCILIGRMLYLIGEHDDWQVIGYLLGTAGTGKSTILENIVKQLYEVADVGILSNNIEKKFGLSALVDKKIFIGPEIKGNLALEQAEFQSMISGESVQVNIKNQTAKSQKFLTPGMLAGNEFPSFTDNSGSISRRIISFMFNYKVKRGDTKLGSKIANEMSYILQACNRGYLWALSEYGSSGIWDILPPYFKESQETMAENTNALTNFLNSENVVLGEELYCREKIFIELFNDHCRDNHFTTTKWTSQFYSGPFSEKGIKVIKNTRRKYPNDATGRSTIGTFIIGIDVVDHSKNDSLFDDDSEANSKC